MNDRTKRSLIRFGKVAIAVVIAGIASKYGNSGWYLAIAPFVVAVDKYLRDK